MTNVNKTNVTAEVLRDMVDEARIVYNWQEIEQKRHRSSSILMQPKPILALAAALILLAVVVAVYTSIDDKSDTPAPLSFELAESTRMLAVPSKATAERRIPLSDGSMITLAPGASLEVMHNTASQFHTTLHQGWVRYNVVPGHQRMWEVDAGLCRVVVKGTQFTVNRTPSRVDVTVHRGAVAVYSSDGDTRLATLTKGKRYTVERANERAKDNGERYLANAPKIKNPIAESSSNKDAKTTDIRSFDKKIIRNGRRAKARTSGIAGAGSLVGMGGSDDVNALLKKVDAARSQNQHQKAARLLGRIIRDYPEDPAIGLVALTLGKIRLDTLNQPQQAAAAFKRATVSAGLPSPLREQAYARGVEAYYRSGDTVAAQKMGVTYRRRYPNGSWNSFIERWTRP